MLDRVDSGPGTTSSTTSLWAEGEGFMKSVHCFQRNMSTNVSLCVSDMFENWTINVIWGYLLQTPRFNTFYQKSCPKSADCGDYCSSLGPPYSPVAHEYTIPEFFLIHGQWRYWLCTLALLVHARCHCCHY